MNRIYQWAIPLATFGLCLTLYLVTLSSDAFPGISASLLAQHLGLTPFPPMDSAVWGWLARAIAGLSAASDVVARLNLFSAVCGAASVLMLYLVMIRLPMTFGPAPLVERKYVFQPARTLSGLFAALYLSVSLPFWIVSDRALTATWDILLLLVPVYCLFRFRTSRRVAWAWAGCLIFGIGTTGLGTMFIIAPLYGLLLLIYMMQNGQLRLRNILFLLLTGLAGLLPWLLYALQIMKTPAYGWRGFKGLGDVLFFMLRDEWHGFKFSVPQTGWLIVGLVSIVPWLIVLIFRLGQNRKVAVTSRRGGYVLNIVLTGLGILLAMNVSFAPCRHAGSQNPVVMPYLLIAMWYGGLASFWYTELIHHEAGSMVRTPRWRKPLGYLVLAIMGATIAVAAVRNYPLADGRSSKLARSFVNETLNNLHGREWLLSSGLLDDNILIAARERKQPLHLLNLPFGNMTAYLKYAASLFDNPRLRGMAQVGLVPLFNEWMALDPTAGGKIAIQNVPDLWLMVNHRPQPQALVYLAETTPPANPDALLREHETTWKALESAKADIPEENPAYLFNQWIIGHASRVANNLGVYFEENGRSDLAFTTYRQALGFQTNNLSAMLNLFALSKRENKTNTDRLEKEIKDALKKSQMHREMWALSFYYGFVRRPEAYAERGWAWAFSGKPNVGYNEMRRAMEMSGNQPGAQLQIANMYLSQNNPEESERTYLAVFQQNPTNQAAILGLERVAVMKRQFDVARGYLQRLRDLQYSPSILMMDEALIDQMSGDLAGAVKILKKLTEESPEHWQAWTALALAADEADDAKLLETAQTKLAQAKRLAPGLNEALAYLDLKRKDLAAARHHLEQVLAAKPTGVSALEMLIKLDVQERRREEAERHVHWLLTIDAHNYLANYILGALQVFNGQYALAEASYRASMAVRRTPEVLNDLGWVLAQQGRLNDALGYSTESVQGDEKNGNAWDTLGYIQMKLGDFAKAEDSLQKAATLMPDNLGIMLHIAEDYEAKGMPKESLQLASQIMARAAELDHDTLDELNTLMKRLRQRGSGT